MASRVLIVCYSRGGSTLRVARHLAEALGADLDRIEENDSREGAGGYLRSLVEAVAKGVPTIRTLRDPADYDLVILGCPVWASTMASPMRAYVLAHRGQLQRSPVFVVMGGRGGEQTVREIQLACRAGDSPSLVLTHREVEDGAFRDLCESFIHRLTGVSRDNARWPKREASRSNDGPLPGVA